MKKSSIYILIHSPLVGPFTWTLVAEQMWQRGLDVVVPTLKDSPDSKEPYWKQHAESVSQVFSDIPKDIPITLVAHSGAGPLLPAIRLLIANPIQAYVFVDAGIPRDGATRLDLMKSEDPEWAKQFQEYLEGGGRFPNWSSDGLREIIPDKDVREKLIADIQPRRLNFFTEPIPVFDGWPDAPCVYIQFSAFYEKPAEQARQAGWATYNLEAGHFHMLGDPKAVADIIIKSVNEIEH